MNLDFSKYAKELDEYSSFRDELIKKARDVLKASKHLIFSIHRKDENQAKSMHTDLLVMKKELDTLAKRDPELFFEGSYSEAIQEYVEAIAFYVLVMEKRVLEKPEDVSIENYLCGLCDLTGEISRYVVNHAIERKIDDVKHLHDVVNTLLGELLKFNMRNGQLRQKYDSVKYNLKNIENVLYDLSLKQP